MSILDYAKEDYRCILGDTDAYSCLLTFVNPTGDVTATIPGHGMSHHLQVDTDGNSVQGKNSHITFSEKELVEAGYPIRNSKNQVALNKHKVSFKDSNDFVSTYIIKEYYPDETLGIITCLLSLYVSS